MWTILVSKAQFEVLIKKVKLKSKTDEFRGGEGNQFKFTSYCCIKFSRIIMCTLYNKILYQDDEHDINMGSCSKLINLDPSYLS